MAMETCPECGGKISTKARQCPHCGIGGSDLSAARERRVNIGCIGIVVVAVLLLCAFCGQLVGGSGQP